MPNKKITDRYGESSDILKRMLPVTSMQETNLVGWLGCIILIQESQLIDTVRQ